MSRFSHIYEDLRQKNDNDLTPLSEDDNDRFASSTNPEIADIKKPATLSSSVGDRGTNKRRDVAKVEKMLGDAGTLDLKKTDGPTGYWGMRTSDATKAFQKKNNLKIDGQINPAGETVKKLGQVLATALKPKTNATSRPAERSATRDPDTQGAAMDPGLRRGDVRGGRQRPTLTDDAVSANGRAARYLAGRTGIGDYATFVADGIETDPDQGIVEAADLIRQTGEQSPTQADELFRKTLDGLGSENAAKLQTALTPVKDDTDGTPIRAGTDDGDGRRDDPGPLRVTIRPPGTRIPHGKADNSFGDGASDDETSADDDLSRNRDIRDEIQRHLAKGGLDPKAAEAFVGLIGDHAWDTYGQSGYDKAMSGFSAWIRDVLNIPEPVHKPSGGGIRG